MTPEGTVRLTTSQALVRWLSVQHSERDGRRQRVVPAIFGIFGHGNVCGLGEALLQEGAGLPLLQPKNEQSMVHTALGYAKASRRLATLACTASIGPGSTNLLTGAGTGATNRLPVLLLPSDTFASRRQGPVLQQIEHPVDADLTVNDCFRPLSRFFDRIVRPEQLLTALPQGMRVLLDPAETGPVTISLPQDVQGEAFDWPERFFAPRTWVVPRRPPVPEELEAVAQALARAERPLVIAGGGVVHSEAEAALVALAERFDLPVAETSAGKGSAGASPVGVGGIGVNGTRAANELAREADLVLCVGTRLTDFTTASHSLFQDPDVAFAGLNVSSADAHKLGALPLVADARVGLERLAEALAGAGGRPSSRGRAPIEEARTRWGEALDADLAPRPGEGLTQGQALRVLNETLRARDWVVAAAGYPPGDLLKTLDTRGEVRAHLEFGFSCMGHELPAALGIRMADREAGEVVAVIGDGTYLLCNGELATAMQEGLELTVLLLVNGGYQSIHGLQRAATGASLGNEFRSREDGALAGPFLDIDYAANAASYGCRTWQARDAEGLRDALVQARAHDGVAVVCCAVEPLRPLLDSGAFWDLGVAEVSADPEVQRRTDEHLAQAAAQRFYG